MKKIVMLVMSVLLVVSVASAADRNIVGAQRADGSYEQVPVVGEMYKKAGYTGNHIYLERTTAGGWLRQYVDRDGDYKCDFILLWRLIEDPKYGKFYGPGGFEKCPDSKLKK